VDQLQTYVCHSVSQECANFEANIVFRTVRQDHWRYSLLFPISMEWRWEYHSSLYQNLFARNHYDTMTATGHVWTLVRLLTSWDILITNITNPLPFMSLLSISLYYLQPKYSILGKGQKQHNMLSDSGIGGPASMLCRDRNHAHRFCILIDFDLTKPTPLPTIGLKREAAYSSTS
jgi:hypothetical protein